MTLLLLLLGFIVVCGLLVIGAPIYLVLGSVAIVLLMVEGYSMPGFGQYVLDHLTSPVLIAVPFFCAPVVSGTGIGNEASASGGSRGNSSDVSATRLPAIMF